MRAISIALLTLVAALPASAQQPRAPFSNSPPAASAPVLRPAASADPAAEKLAADKAAAEKAAAEKRIAERKAAADKGAADKARLAMDAKIEANDRKMKRAMYGICSGCLVRPKGDR